jgi:hypothetical protein
VCRLGQLLDRAIQKGVAVGGDMTLFGAVLDNVVMRAVVITGSAGNVTIYQFNVMGMCDGNNMASGPGFKVLCLPWMCRGLCC